MSEEHSASPDLPPEWREVWQALETPPALDADDAPTDPQARAAVEWMRAAWDSLTVPEPVPQPEPGGVMRRLVPLALAAAAALVLWLTRGPAEPPPPEVHVAAPPPLVAPQVDLTPESLATPIRPHMREDGSVELRSGEVLLILVENPQ